MSQPIDIGEFCLIYDGSRSGHPGCVVWKDDIRNLYLLIRFGTTKNSKNTLFDHPIGSKAAKTYYYKRLILAKRKDLKKSVFRDLSILEDERLKLFNELKNKCIKFSQNINRTDRRYFFKNFK